MNTNTLKRTIGYSGGFTILELVSVLIVLSIIGIIAVSRFTSTSIYSTISEAETLKANIRYAQYRALTDADMTYNSNNSTWSLLFTADSYTLQRIVGGVTTNPHLPFENSATHSLPAGITLAYSAASVIFDVWGSPGVSNITISVTDGNSPQTITVTGNTGFIP